MTLDEQYQKVIDDQRAHLLKVQEDFNKACDVAKAKAKEKLNTLPQEDKETKEAVLKDQKAELEAALHILKQEVNYSTRETMKKLEGIVHAKEKLILEDLEKQLAAL